MNYKNLIGKTVFDFCNDAVHLLHIFLWICLHKLPPVFAAACKNRRLRIFLVFIITVFQKKCNRTGKFPV